MSIIIPANSAASGGFEAANSARFNGTNQFLSRTISSASTPTKLTTSFWFKRAILGSTQRIVTQSNNGGSNNFYWRFSSGDKLEMWNQIDGSSTWCDIVTSRVFRDTTAWYHICCVWDSTQGTEANRMKLYINGVQEAAANLSTNTYPSQNSTFGGFASTSLKIDVGYYRASPGEYINGYLSEFVIADGQALTPTDFGEFDEDSGIWKAKAISGLTFGTNGSYLNFKNSSELGTDVSGNSNTFTENNLAATDQTTDTCTNNFATLNVLNSTLNDTVLSQGNLILVGGNQSVNYSYITSTIAPSSGKWYWEVKAVDNSEIDQVGVAKTDLAQFSNIDTSSGLQATTYGGKGVQMSNGYKVGDGSGSAYMGGFSANDICMVALDLDNTKITFGRNGQWANGSGSANQTYGNSTAAFTNLTAGVMYAAAQCMRDSAGNNPGTLEYNFGNPTFSGTDQADGNDKGSFEYAPPTGFLSLCSKNLSEVNS